VFISENDLDGQNMQVSQSFVDHNLFLYNPKTYVKILLGFCRGNQFDAICWLAYKVTS